MVDKEDLECAICRNEFSRNYRIPRMLHCKHTFCSCCLNQLSEKHGIYRIAACPLCRSITCSMGFMTLPESLWVNTVIWDMIEDDNNPIKSPNANIMKSKPNPDPTPTGFRSKLKNLFTHILQKEQVIKN